METVERPVERKVILHNARWRTYERLLAEQESSSAPRFTYDRGELEIMSPSTEHEEHNRTIALLVELFAEEAGLDVRHVGSMTFRREDLGRGFEPDSCFYVQNEENVSGKAHIDLASDPPPDLSSRWTSPAHLSTSFRSTRRSVSPKSGAMTVGGWRSCASNEPNTPPFREAPSCHPSQAPSSPTSSQIARSKSAGTGCAKCASGPEAMPAPQIKGSPRA